KTLRYKWLDLLLVDAKAHESLRPTSSEGFFSAIGEAFDLTGRMPVRPTMTATELAVLAQGRRELETKIAAIRPQQEQIVREALRAKKEMLESAQLQEIRSRDLRPELNDTIEAQKDEYAALTLRLYEAAEWYEADGLPRVIEQYRFIADGDEDMRELMTAKMALARAENLDERLIVQASLPNGITANHPLIAESQAERIKALRAVDAVLRVNPKSKEALEMRQKIELYFIHEIAAKLEREKQLSMAAFRRYLSERGFNPDDPKGYCDIAWDFAHRWMGWIFTSHTGAIISRGLANEAVEAVEIQTMAAAKNQVALLAIRRLVRLGFPLPKIRDITVRELSTSLTLKTLDKKPLDPAKAARMCREIHEAFVELYDLNALAKRDLDAFVKYSSMAYYQIVNPEKGRLEFWSDFIYSPWGLFTWFSPFAVCKVNGKWALHGGEVSAALSLDKATKVERLTDVFAATIEASRLGQWFKNTGVGKGIIQRIVADQRLVGGMGAGMQLLNEAGHLAGVITVVCGVFYVAEELDIPGVTRLIEGIVVLGGVESVYGYLSRAGAPLRRALAQIDQVKMIIAQKRAALAEAMQRTAEVERRMAAVSGPRGMTARDIAEIEAILKRYPREYQFLEAPPLPQAGAQPARSSQAVTQPTPSSQAVTQPAPSQAVTQSAHPSQAVTKSAHPGANPESDVARAVTGAGVAVRAGNPAEAKRAIGAAKQLQQSMMKTLDEMYVKAEQAEKLLAEHGIEEVVVGRVALADASRKISEISNPEAMQLALLDQPLNLTGEFGLFIHHGDRALQKGDLATAKKLYTAAHEEAFTRGVDAELTLAEKRLALLKLGEDEIQKLAVRRASTPATAIPKITGSADDMTRHLNGPGAGRIKVLDESGVNPSFVCVGPNGEEYIFKVMQDTGRGMDECLAYDLWGGLNEVGPGAMYVKGLNAPEIVNNPRVMERLGQLTPPKEVQGVLVRRFKGVELGSLTEAEVMALKKELADIRAFRVFIGDTDGHYRNVLVMGEGKPAPIDFDYANIITKADSTGRARHYLRQLSRRCDDAEQLMTDCMQMRSLAESAGERPGPLYAWVDRLDSMLSYDDMAPMVKKIKDLCSRNNG
ncbi:hypothetical protein FJY63_05850, partial [Candidatus Sumerlaeota bacterium]|nr:hypothetical protein [Candidatus Sumerlaeota bacterium]